jgi:hypothetical protein
MEREDADENESEEDESGGDDSDDEDGHGVKIGRFGKLEVVADEDEEDEGADAFNQDEYKQAMAALRQGRMASGDLQGMDLDTQAKW